MIFIKLSSYNYLRAKKPDTRKWAEEFSGIKSEEDFKNFCQKNEIPENDQFIDVLYVVASAKTSKMELSTEELDAVSTIATGGLLGLAKGIIQSGLASVGKDALMYGALNILSTGTGMAVTKIAGI